MGNFKQEIENKKEIGQYPATFNSYEAHDSYFGIVAQLGFGYLMFLISFFYSIVSIYKRLDYQVKYPILLFLLYMMFESLSIGSLHYRHYYVFFGLLVVLYEMDFNSLNRINTKE